MTTTTTEIGGLAAIVRADLARLTERGPELDCKLTEAVATHVTPTRSGLYDSHDRWEVVRGTAQSMAETAESLASYARAVATLAGAEADDAASRSRATL